VKVVVNATPLIALSLVEHLDLLPQMFSEVLVPSAVYEEVAVQGRDKPGGRAFTGVDWIDIRTPVEQTTIEPLLLGLDEGELQVLLLARSEQPEWVVIDERLGRRVARAMGLPVKGTVGILLAAYCADLLTKSQAQDLPRRLVAVGIRIHPRIIGWYESELSRS
jgi:predicted nucleic acid-binding protein